MLHKVPTVSGLTTFQLCANLSGVQDDGCAQELQSLHGQDLRGGSQSFGLPIPSSVAVMSTLDSDLDRIHARPLTP